MKENQNCRRCGNHGHFQKCCRTRLPKQHVQRGRNQERRQISSLDSIDKQGKPRFEKDEWYVSLDVNRTRMSFKLDTGASVSVASQ